MNTQFPFPSPPPVLDYLPSNRIKHRFFVAALLSGLAHLVCLALPELAWWFPQLTLPLIGTVLVLSPVLALLNLRWTLKYRLDNRPPCRATRRCFTGLLVFAIINLSLMVCLWAWRAFAGFLMLALSGC